MWLRLVKGREYVLYHDIYDRASLMRVSADGLERRTSRAAQHIPSRSQPPYAISIYLASQPSIIDESGDWTTESEYGAEEGEATSIEGATCTGRAEAF